MLIGLNHQRVQIAVALRDQGMQFGPHGGCPEIIDMRGDLRGPVHIRLGGKEGGDLA